MSTRVVMPEAFQDLPAPTAHENHVLAVRASRGDVYAKAELATRNWRLVFAVIARHYSQIPLGSMEMADLVQEGLMGLSQAADRYQPNGDAQFGTYASYWVRGAIKDSLPRRDTIRVPQSARERHRAIRKAVAAVDDAGEAIDIEQVAQEADVDPRDVLEYLERPRAAVSMDAPVIEGGDTELSEILDLQAPSPRKTAMSEFDAEILSAFQSRTLSAEFPELTRVAADWYRDRAMERAQLSPDELPLNGPSDALADLSFVEIARAQRYYLEGVPMRTIASEARAPFTEIQSGLDRVSSALNAWAVGAPAFRFEDLRSVVDDQRKALGKSPLSQAAHAETRRDAVTQKGISLPHVDFVCAGVDQSVIDVATRVRSSNRQTIVEAARELGRDPDDAATAHHAFTARLRQWSAENDGATFEDFCATRTKSRELIAKHLGDLSPEEALAVRAIHLEGSTTAEVADRLDATARAALNRVHSGERTIASLVGNLEERGVSRTARLAHSFEPATAIDEDLLAFDTAGWAATRMTFGRTGHSGGIRRAARECGITEQQARTRIQKGAQIVEGWLERNPGATFADFVDEREALITKISDACGRLPENEALIVREFVLNGRSARSVASDAGCSDHAVPRRADAALDSLRRRFAAEARVQQRQGASDVSVSI